MHLVPVLRSMAARAAGVAGIALMLSAGATPLRAQVASATLSGTVEDPTGAIIPGASVVLRNLKNNYERKTTANSVAVFSFPSIDPGDYVLTVSMPGFQTFVERGIHLNPQDSRTLTDIKMQIGAVSQTVTVEAKQENIDTGERSSIITEEDIRRLSTVGRDVSELLKILPGSAIAASNAGLPAGGSGGATNTTYDPSQVSVGGGSGQYAMSGSPLNGVSVRSDGANLDDPSSYSGTTQNINMDMTAEVKVSTSNFGAETANGPVVINAVGKQGGSQYHGSLYVYARTYQLNSTDALAPELYSGCLSNCILKPDDRYIYPGFNVGGPIRIPGTKFNSTNKLTFFLGGEAYEQRNAYAYGNAGSAIIRALVPTPGMRTGDFSPAQISAYLGPGAVACGTEQCNPIQPKTDPNGDLECYSPTICGGLAYQNVSTVPIAGSNGALITNGSVAPYLDPGALAIINHMPLPNRTNPGDGFNYVTTNLITNNLWQARGRLDLAQTDNDKYFVVYNIERGKNGVPQAPGYSPAGQSGGIDTPGGLLQEINSQSGSFNWTRVLSKTLTNEAFASLSYLQSNYVPAHAALLQAAGIGYPYSAAYANATTQYPQLSDYGNNGLPVALYPDFTQLPRGQFDTRFTPGLGDNLTKVLGSHTIKVGLNIERATNNEVLPNTYTNGQISNYYVPPTFSVTNAQTGGTSTYHSTCYNPANDGCESVPSPNLLAGFEEGEIQTFYQNNIDPALDTYWWNVSVYYSDDWKIKPNLTLTYGLRIEHLGAWNDAHGIGAAVWNPATVNDPFSDNPTPNKDTLPGFLWHQIDPSIPVSGTHSRFAFFEPRVGASWDITGTGKTIIRGGYGQYRYHDNWNDVAMTMAYPVGYRGVTFPIETPNSQGSIGQANGETLAGVGTYNLPLNAGGINGSIAGLDSKDTEEPLTQTYSVTVSRQLMWNSVLDVAYVGNASKYILNDGSNNGIDVDNVNAIKPGGLYQLPPDGRPNPCTTVYGGTVNGICTPQAVIGLSPAQIQFFRPYINYQNIQVESHQLWSNYNSLQTTWNKQKGRATYAVNYTFSKALGVHGGYSNGPVADAFNLSNDYGVLAYDRTHVFNASYSYAAGTIYHGSRILQQTLNGWMISGITSFQSGPNLQFGNYSSNFGLNGQVKPASATGGLPLENTLFLGTPDVALQPLLLCDPRNGLQAKQYINGNCFQLPQYGAQQSGSGYTFAYNNGPFKYPYVHGPAYFDSDLTVAKDFPLSERQNLQFRLAAFNFLNHPLNTFVGSFPQYFQLGFNNVANSNPAGAHAQPAFGFTPYETGRRVMELALKYTF